MSVRSSRIVLIVLFLALGSIAADARAREPEKSSGSYQDLVELFAAWREFQPPRLQAGVPDYTAAAMAGQHRELAAYQERLKAIDIAAWPVEQQIDWWLVWAEMNGLDFDHRVMRPWARDPAFYALLIDSESDTPLKEGPVNEAAIELWRLTFPLDSRDLDRLRFQLGVIPPLLEQAKSNLTGDARDLWQLGIRTQQGQSAQFEALAQVLQERHPDLVPVCERARQATDDFAAWLEAQFPSKQGPSGIGVDNYTWYLQNVHLLPYSWEDELRLMERELARSVSNMKLEEHQNRSLPPLDPPDNPAAWDTLNEVATRSFMDFLEDDDVLEVEAFMEPALRERLIGWVPPEDRHFFLQVAMRDPRVLHSHFIHWIDKAYLREHPHQSPIRRTQSLYNIWDSRSEGLATAFEEMMMSAGMFADSPRSRELVYIMIAMRAARAIAGLRVQSNELTVEEATKLASGATPRGWFRADGNLVLFEQQLYLRQPGYGTSYLTGKTLIDALMAERAQQLGTAFTLKGFMTELFEVGMIPVSLARWEMVGRSDWLPSMD
jgi:hypothetical protein